MNLKKIVMYYVLPWVPYVSFIPSVKNKWKEYSNAINELDPQELNDFLEEKYIKAGERKKKEILYMLTESGYYVRKKMNYTFSALASIPLALILTVGGLRSYNSLTDQSLTKKLDEKILVEEQQKKNELYKIFGNLDKNKNGTIDFTEFMNYYTKHHMRFRY